MKFHVYPEAGKVVVDIDTLDFVLKFTPEQAQIVISQFIQARRAALKDKHRFKVVKCPNDETG